MDSEKIEYEAHKKIDPLWTIKLKNVNEKRKLQVYCDENLDRNDDRKLLGENYNEENRKLALIPEENFQENSVENTKVENWLEVAKKKLKKIEGKTPKKIITSRIMKKENLTPGSSNKKKKITVGDRKKKIDEIKKLWEAKDENTVIQKIKNRNIKKIMNKNETGMSSDKVGKLLTNIQNDENSVKIRGNMLRSNEKSGYSQTRIDAWIRRKAETGNQTRDKEHGIE